MRELTDKLKTQKNKEYNRPIELYQIFLGEETLYLTPFNEDIEFYDEDGNEVTYKSRGMSRSSIETSVEQRSNQVNISIDNVSREMGSYLAHYDLRNKIIAIWQVFVDELDDPGHYIPLFYGIMDEPSVDEQKIEFTAYSRIDMYDSQVPARKFTATCPWRFGDENCGVEVPTKSGTVDSVSDFTKLYLSEIVGDDDHYWAYGNITVNGETRYIVDSGDGWVEIRIPFFSDPEGEEYELEAGCDKTMGENNGCKNWDNEEFFGGFLSIPDDREGGL